ncbi:MAG: glutaredoxin family protein [Gammaproteobacteria bacterium]|uniref:Glutaredoxin family protein n=1 Tax=Candidatus Thiopontia autotrophica TaxID=2841688 RepID=A0A8J6PBC4_9GAMM|nr:glutaredoxin family protein [Candidatus Thiopontia autotrophica]MBL6968970.1 glutaredoxin family protein [Gammaproteobacteria bacterium]
MVRQGCHLCDDMEELLTHHPLRDRFKVERIVINNVPELESQYGTKVPVLLEQSEEICHYFLDEKRLRECLGK